MIGAVARYDLVIIGAGSGGIPAAQVAAAFGLRVALVERARVGGDCLWTGCVPSKALLAAARQAQAMRQAGHFGLPAVTPEIDSAAVWDYLRGVRAGIAASDDNPDRLRHRGIDVIEGEASVAGAHEVVVRGGAGVESRLPTGVVLVCTGSRPAEPPIEGLAAAGYLTNESVFELERAPDSVVIVGGGPVGTELAQALVRLGVRVTLVQRGRRILARDEPRLAERLERRLIAEGVEVVTGVEIHRVTVEEGHKVAHGALHDQGEEAGAFPAAEVVVACGRLPNVEALGLDVAGVEVGPLGIRVDEHGRTNVGRIYAAGDVTGHPSFTHAAAHDAVAVVRDAFFPGRGRRARLVPWCTFTDPELAHVGLTEADARAQFGKGVRAWRFDLAGTDRARTDGVADAEMVAITDGSRRLVGAHILAPHAGDMIGELVLAIDRELRIDDLAAVVHVYPTLATGVQQLAARAEIARWRGRRWLTWPARLAGRWAR